MLRWLLALAIGLVLVPAPLWAADKEVKGKITKINVDKKLLVVDADGVKKEYTVSDDTKFFGPRGGASEVGIKDDRLIAGAEVKLVVAGNNKTVREVHILSKRKGAPE